MARLFGLRDVALRRIDIAKALVNHRQRRGCDLRLEYACGVVGMDHNTGHRRGGVFVYVPAMKSKGGGVFVVAAQGDLGLACSLKCRNLSDGSRASRHSQNIRLRWHPPKSPGGGT